MLRPFVDEAQFFAIADAPLLCYEIMVHTYYA